MAKLHSDYQLLVALSGKAGLDQAVDGAKRTLTVAVDSFNFDPGTKKTAKVAIACVCEVVRLSLKKEMKLEDQIKYLAKLAPDKMKTMGMLADIHFLECAGAVLGLVVTSVYAAKDLGKATTLAVIPVAGEIAALWILGTVVYDMTTSIMDVGTKCQPYLATESSVAKMSKKGDVTAADLAKFRSAIRNELVGISPYLNLGQLKPATIRCEQPKAGGAWH